MTTLQTPGTHTAVLSQCILVLAAIAGKHADRFAEQYYTPVMGVLKVIIRDASGKDLYLLRSRAMEAAGFIGEAVGSDVFLNDAREVMQLFATMMQDSGSVVAAADDQTEEAMLGAWVKMATTLGAEFAPCLPHLMPRVLAMARREPDESMIEGNHDSSPAQLQVRSVTSHFVLFFALFFSLHD
jgi:hypothetical protein